MMTKFAPHCMTYGSAFQTQAQHTPVLVYRVQQGRQLMLQHRWAHVHDVCHRCIVVLEDLAQDVRSVQR